MPTPKATKRNPHALTQKQALVIGEIVEQVSKGKPVDPVAATALYYNTKHPAQIANQNYNKLNFREALLAGLATRKIVGTKSRIEKRLVQGLDAKKLVGNKEKADYQVRLAYIQEVNKIVGLYAPQKVESKSLNVSIDLDQKELDEQIKLLKQELSN